MSKYSAPILKKIHSCLQSIADLFFPRTCFGCGAENTWLCPSCLHRIPLLRSQECFRCQKIPTRYGEACAQCQDTHPLDAVFSATCYQIPVVKKMIHAYKYHFLETMALPLGDILTCSIEQSNLPLPHALVPVPLHSKRLRSRGFNQSLLLCQSLTKNIEALHNTPILSALQRIRFTQPQQKTPSKEERAYNMAQAFQLLPEENITDKVLWLVDDVSTTQSTLRECAAVLKKAGAKKVYAVVLAKD